MNSDQIEKLLRKPPRLAIPRGLRERLEADIQLPTERRSEPVRDHAPSFLKRWLPALSVALWLLACVVILGVQSHTLSNLRQANDALRTAVTEMQQVAPASAEPELTRLRADAEEVRRLRAEMARATAQLDQLKAIRAENERLSEQLKSAHASASLAPEQDFFAKADNVKCINNLKQVGLGARMWANDHNEALPTSFDQMQNELPNKSVLFCPAGEATVQYEIVSPGAPETDPQVVYAYCRRHNKVVLCDGSVQSLGKTSKLVVRPDGKTVLGR